MKCIFVNDYLLINKYIVQKVKNKKYLPYNSTFNKIINLKY